MKKQDRFFVIFVLLILSLFFVLTPFFIRSLQGNSSLLNEESYFHLGIAQNIVDPGKYPLPDVTPIGFEVFVAGLVSWFDPLLVAKILPVILGVLCVSIFVWRADTLLEGEESLVSGLLFIFSPIFLIAANSLSPAILVLFLFILSWALYDRFPWLSVPLLLILTIVDAKGFLIAGVLLLAYGLLQERWRPAAIGLALGGVIIAVLKVAFGFFAQNALAAQSSIGQFFASLGAEFGYSFFILFLALAGLIAGWQARKARVTVTIIIAGVFLLSFSEGLARVLLLPLIAVLAAKGLRSLFYRSWDVAFIKNVTLFLIGLSLLFTVVMTITNLVHAEPSSEKMGALLFLRTVPQGDVVLSSAENGILIERIAGAPALLDQAGGSDEADAQVAEKIFLSQRFSVTRDLLVQYNITHILIDGAMRDGGVWTNQEQGLLFLLQHHPAFVPVYTQGDVEVYRFVQR